MMFFAPGEALGSSLSRDVQEECKRLFVHRYTGEHKPQWANKTMPNGEAYKPSYDTDVDWLAHTIFRVTKAGNLDKRYKLCYSYRSV